MSLAQNKKGMELSTLAEILLVVIGAGLLIGVFTVASSRAEEKTSENLCRAFNALRFGTKIEEGPVSLNVVPRACKTIDKNDLPGKDYKEYIGGVQEGAKAEIRDLMARCWWMWLEGNQQNMFEKGWYQQNGCFICYTFPIAKSVGTIPYQDFAASLNTPYYAVDSSDRCAPSGQGGKCMPLCDASSTYFSREVASNRCKPDEKCCIADDKRDECKNKGGKCLNNPTEPYTKYYGKWQCKEGACYIKKEYLASYLDYIQGTGGVSGGAGKVLFGDNEDFKSSQKYAITFVSPGKSWNVDTLVGLGTTGVGVYVVYGVAAASGILTVPTLIVATGVAASALLTSGTGSINDINYIMLSKYDTVSSKCAIEAGVGEE